MTVGPAEVEEFEKVPEVEEIVDGTEGEKGFDDVCDEPEEML